MCPDWESNQWLFGLQAGIQSTEPHQLRLYLYILRRFFTLFLWYFTLHPLLCFVSLNFTLDIHLLSIILLFCSTFREISPTLSIGSFTDLKNISAIKILILRTLLWFLRAPYKIFWLSFSDATSFISQSKCCLLKENCLLLLTLFIFHLSCPLPPLLLCFSLLTFLKYLLIFGCAYPLRREDNWKLHFCVFMWMGFIVWWLHYRLRLIWWYWFFTEDTKV